MNQVPSDCPIPDARGFAMPTGSLRKGDLAITTNKEAGWPPVGEGVLVEIIEQADPTYVCCRVRKFLCHDMTISSVAKDWLELVWRPE